MLSIAGNAHEDRSAAAPWMAAVTGRVAARMLLRNLTTGSVSRVRQCGVNGAAVNVEVAPLRGCAGILFAGKGHESKCSHHHGVHNLKRRKCRAHCGFVGACWQSTDVHSLVKRRCHWLAAAGWLPRSRCWTTAQSSAGPRCGCCGLDASGASSTTCILAAHFWQRRTRVSLTHAAGTPLAHLRLTNHTRQLRSTTHSDSAFTAVLSEQSPSTATGDGRVAGAAHALERRNHQSCATFDHLRRGRTFHVTASYAAPSAASARQSMESSQTPMPTAEHARTWYKCRSAHTLASVSTVLREEAAHPRSLDGDAELAKQVARA